MIILAVSIGKISAQSSVADDYREIKCRVVEEAGWPVANTEVVLRGLGRDSLNARFDVEGTDPKRAEKCHGWKFKTDKDGYFTARFGKFLQYEHEQATGSVEPGYGNFYFVIEKPGFAGGVSQQLFNLNDQDLADYKTRAAAAKYLPAPGDGEGEEWEASPVVLSDEADAGPLKIELFRGIEVTGKIQDTKGQPVANEDIDLFLDLHADSHSGHGGEVFSQIATSDRNGRFHFENVYPNTFYLELLNHSEGPPYWIKTRVRNRWIDAAQDEITPEYKIHTDKFEESIPILIVVSRQPSYRYFGRVTDGRGHPVAGANVEINCSLHQPSRTYEDGHDYRWKTKTDRDGNYSIRVGFPFAIFISVSADGYLDDDQGDFEYDLAAPGRYDFTLTRK